MNNRIAEWFYKYSDDVYHFLVYLLSSSDVEDLVQEVFIKALKGIDRYEGAASPKTWLLAIARHVAIDEIRKRKTAKWKGLLFSSSDTDVLDLPGGQHTPEDILLIQEEFDEALQLIGKLKRTYREVIILRGIKQLSVEETAAILQWSENKVRSTYHRARKALRKELGGK